MPGALTQPDARKAGQATLADAGAHFVLCWADKRPKTTAWQNMPAPAGHGFAPQRAGRR